MRGRRRCTWRSGLGRASGLPKPGTSEARARSWLGIMSEWQRDWTRYEDLHEGLMDLIQERAGAFARAVSFEFGIAAESVAGSRQPNDPRTIPSRNPPLTEDVR